MSPPTAAWLHSDRLHGLGSRHLRHCRQVCPTTSPSPPSPPSPMSPKSLNFSKGRSLNIGHFRLPCTMYLIFPAALMVMIIACLCTEGCSGPTQCSVCICIATMSLMIATRFVDGGMFWTYSVISIGFSLFFSGLVGWVGGASESACLIRSVKHKIVIWILTLFSSPLFAGFSFSSS